MPETNNSGPELPVGRIAGVFGIRGELKCDPTSAGRMLFTTGAALRIRLADGSSDTVRLAAVREHKDRLLIRLPGVESANDAQVYINATFYADRGRIELERGEFLDVDLIGCDLVDVTGKTIGAVSAVQHYPSSDMLIVRGKMVPMVAAFIKSIDVRSKRITVDLPLGLLDDTQAEEG
ncbi:MAG TPA: ribosome maturation factor RimM [Candidatus Baltobacteraceae bacterium]